MKKIYKQPETIIVLLNTQPLLNIVSNGDGTMNGGGNQGDLSENDDILSRSFGFWDDDEE